MASNGWIAETVGDFIHSSIWAAPIHTFIDEYCATFDYDDEDEGEEQQQDATASAEEQQQIYRKYQRLVEALIAGLGHDLSLDAEELKRVCDLPDNSAMIDESYEQLYSARDFQLFQEMMRRKNLILQLQALVSLQLQWGLLKQTDTGDDLVLSLLLQATKSPSRRASIEPTSPPPLQRKAQQPVDDEDDDDEDVVMSKPPAKEPIRLPGLRQKGEADVDWYRDLPPRPSEAASLPPPSSISEISQTTLREKLRELTDRTSASVDDGTTASAIQSRKDFLQKQRDLLLRKQRAERKEDLDQQTRNARPQSAAHAARKAMTNLTPDTESEPKSTIPESELAKRRAMVDKLKRAVVDKH